MVSDAALYVTNFMHYIEIALKTVHSNGDSKSVSA